MQDRSRESQEDAGNRVAPAEPAAKKHHVPKEDGLSNPKDGRGPLRSTDDQCCKLPIH
jgi:hypothetical protein